LRLQIRTGAFLFSILSFVISNVISKNRAKKDKQISDARYEEQKKQYEERLSEERKRREEDKRDMEERRRLSERPYLVYKRSEIVSTESDECVTIRIGHPEGGLAEGSFLGLKGENLSV